MTEMDLKTQTRPWDTNHDGLRQIFCAALQGICANPAFASATYQQSPQAAVEFADAVVLAAVNHSRVPDEMRAP